MLGDERTHVKHETPETLHSDAVLNLSHFCIDVPPFSRLGASSQVMTVCLCSDYPSPDQVLIPGCGGSLAPGGAGGLGQSRRVGGVVGGGLSG